MATNFDHAAWIENRMLFGSYLYTTAGSGVPDRVAIKFFKDFDNIIVIDRKQRMWRKGKRYRENINKLEKEV